MFRYKLTIEYDGTNFHGWQRQLNLPTVQEEVEKAIKKLSGSYHHVQCSGRTDAGVHAYGQVAHVDLEKNYKPFEVRNALNFFLREKGVVIIESESVDNDFHARFSTKNRSYVYKILNRFPPSALDENRLWHVVKPLNIEKIIEGSKFLLGMHDFTSFRAGACQSHSPIKTIDEIKIIKNEEQIHFYFKSKSFLHHQVRNMVGTLKLVGTEKWTPLDVKNALEKKDRRAGGPTAPAHGLYFIEASY